MKANSDTVVHLCDARTQEVRSQKSSSATKQVRGLPELHQTLLPPTNTPIQPLKIIDLKASEYSLVFQRSHIIFTTIRFYDLFWKLLSHHILTQWRTTRGGNLPLPGHEEHEGHEGLPLRHSDSCLPLLASGTQHYTRFDLGAFKYHAILNQTP